MKKLIIILIYIVPFLLQAQNKEGSITYEETTKLELNFKGEGIDMERIKSMMPSSNTAKKELIFTEKHSIYRESKSDDEKEEGTFESESGDVSIKVMRSGSNSELYSDHEKQTTVEKRDFMGRMFLVSGDKDVQKWKIGSATKEVIGYQCQQAILQKDSTELTAWFTPQIQVSAGPSGYGGLPGMILEINVDNGQRVITATKVEFNSQNTSGIKPPKKGKAVSKDQFQKIMTEKMKEMGEMRGGNTFIRVIEGQ